METAKRFIAMLLSVLMLINGIPVSAIAESAG